MKEYEDVKRAFGKRWVYHFMPAVSQWNWIFIPPESMPGRMVMIVPADLLNVRITRNYADEETKRWFYGQRRLERVMHFKS